MQKTIDDKIDQLKHEGIDKIPPQNTLRNLPIIKELIFATQCFECDTDEFCIN